MSARVATRVANRPGVAVAPRRVPKNRRAPRRARASQRGFRVRHKKTTLRSPRATTCRETTSVRDAFGDAVGRRSSGAARARAGPRGRSGGSTKDEGACVASRRTSFACMGACAMVALSQILGACVVSWDANVRVVGHRGTRRGRARPGTEDARRASGRRARDALSRSCGARATNGGRGALGHHMLARS